MKEVCCRFRLLDFLGVLLMLKKRRRVESPVVQTISIRLLQLVGI